MGIAIFISTNSRASSNLDDECAWYAMNFLIDTTLGLALSLVFLYGVETMARYKGWETLKDTGGYEGEGSWKIWGHQGERGAKGGSRLLVLFWWAICARSEATS